MRERWESNFPTTGNGLYSLVAVWPTRHPTRVKQPPVTSPVQGWTTSNPFLDRASESAIKAGVKQVFRYGLGRNVRSGVRKGGRTDGRTDGQSLCHPAWPPRDPMDSWEHCYLWGSGGRGAIVCPSRDMRKPVVLTKSPAADEGSASTIVVSGADKNTIWIFQRDLRKERLAG